MTRHLAEDHSAAYLLTLTMRHHAGQRLGDLWDGLATAWRSVISGRAWVAERKRLGIRGWVRVVEVTHGEHGWHVHVHALVLTHGALSVDELQSWYGAVLDRWSKGLEKGGFSALPEGQDVRRVHDGGELAARYLAKGLDSPRVGFEMTGSATKSGRGGSRTPWEILDAVEQGDADALDQWHEWETSSRGRRQIGWSRGLREDLALGEEQDDEEIAAEDIGTADQLCITPDGWSTLVASWPLIPELLNVAIADGIDAAARFLDDHGVEWVPSILGRTVDDDG